MTIKFDETTKRWTLGELEDGLLHSLLKGMQAVAKGIQATALTTEDATEVLERLREKLCESTPNKNNNDTMD